MILAALVCIGVRFGVTYEDYLDPMENYLIKKNLRIEDFSESNVYFLAFENLGEVILEESRIKRDPKVVTQNL